MKKILSLALSIVMLMSVTAGMSFTADAYNYHSQKEAVEWAQNMANSHWEINDGSGQTQCTEFVWQYYEWFLGRHVSGHAYHYLTDQYGACPYNEGWTRPDKSTVKAGDIVIWDANAYVREDRTDYVGDKGHIGVVISVNGNTMVTAEANAGEARGACGIKTNREVSCISGIIRPKFNCTTHTWNNGVITKKPTCKADGEKLLTCTVCGETKTDTVKKGEAYHQFKVTKTTKASLIMNGKLSKTCSVCNKETESTIYRIKSVNLKKQTHIYNSKAQEGIITVKDCKDKVIPEKYYTVAYKNNKNVGQATVGVVFKGRYMGAKTLHFNIYPKSTSLTTLSAGTNYVKAYWNKKNSQVSGYQVQYSTDSKFAKNVSTATVEGKDKVGRKVTKLKSGKKYYFRVRTYKNVKVDGKTKKFCSKWSNKKAVTTKKPAPKLTNKQALTLYKKANSFAEKWLLWQGGCYYMSDDWNDQIYIGDNPGNMTDYAIPVYHKSINSVAKLKKSASNYFTTGVYNKIISTCYRDINGKLYFVSNYGIGTPYGYKLKSVKVVSQNGDTAKVQIKINEYDGKKVTRVLTRNLRMKYVNNKWLFTNKFYIVFCGVDIKL